MDPHDASGVTHIDGGVRDSPTRAIKTNDFDESGCVCGRCRSGRAAGGEKCHGQLDPGRLRRHLGLE